jgi:hypothetical protein
MLESIYGHAVKSARRQQLCGSAIAPFQGIGALPQKGKAKK